MDFSDSGLQNYSLSVNFSAFCHITLVSKVIMDAQKSLTGGVNSYSAPFALLPLNKMPYNQLLLGTLLSELNQRILFFRDRREQISIIKIKEPGRWVKEKVVGDTRVTLYNVPSLENLRFI